MQIMWFCWSFQAITSISLRSGHDESQLGSEAMDPAVVLTEFLFLFLKSDGQIWKLSQLGYSHFCT